jgi:hypothetical protein
LIENAKGAKGAKGAKMQESLYNSHYILVVKYLYAAKVNSTATTAYAR